MSINFGDLFPGHYFDASEDNKRLFIKEYIDESAIKECKENFLQLIQSLSLSNFSTSFVLRCYQCLGDLWFILPTSTGGKYHGGKLDKENSVGGIFEHISKVVARSGKVLNRYRELINADGDTYCNYKELLLVACLLHDVGRLGRDCSSIYSCSDHGEVGASIIKECWSKGDYQTLFENEKLSSNLNFKFYLDELIFSVCEHMYMWRGINFLDSVKVKGLTPSLILCIMLCECDYYSF